MPGVYSCTCGYGSFDGIFQNCRKVVRDYVVWVPCMRDVSTHRFVKCHRAPVIEHRKAGTLERRYFQ